MTDRNEDALQGVAKRETMESLPGASQGTLTGPPVCEDTNPVHMLLHTVTL